MEYGPGAKTVEVVDYDPAWPARFAAERALLAGVLPGASAIEHVGSTSVPGLCAKPTIDILAVVPDVEDVRERTDALARHGYDYRPGSFPDDEQHLFFRKVADGRRTHHLHVVAAGSPLPEDYRLFRDYLRSDDEAAREYGRLKRALADRHAAERPRYIAEKSAFVDELMARARRRAGGS
ncbi:GrpB family protein [Streptomyces sp. DW26H14]|uniref:GrpB family protein n=1 Tax=Streptomyces sp. DW26H14 TaxID=3435395 RepID=UPI00403E2335